MQTSVVLTYKRKMIVLPFFFVINLLFSPFVNTMELPDLGDSSGSLISPVKERQLSKAVLGQLRKSGAPFLEDEIILHYLNSLLEELANHTQYEGEFEMCLIESRAINAFAVPGGLICFHSGLILETQEESELVSVLAHEITHITQRHGARMIESSSRMKVPVIAAMLSAMALTVADPQAGYAALMATQAAGTQYRINFTRSNEKEADAIGIKLMSQSGYDTSGMPKFFNRMYKANRYSDPKMIPEYLRTHPLTVNRISEAASRAEDLQPVNKKPSSRDYHLMLARLRAITSKNPAETLEFFNESIEQATGIHKLSGRYGRVIVQRRLNKFQEARTEVTDLIAQYPELSQFYIEASYIDRDSGNYLKSLETINLAYSKNPSNPAVAYSLIDSLMILDLPSEAKKIIGGFDIDTKVGPKFHKTLADIEFSLGNPELSKISMAEYFYELGYLGKAIAQLRVATTTGELSNYHRLKATARLQQLEKELTSRIDERM